MRQGRHIEYGLILVLFLAAFLPRFIYPVSRPSQWFVRSVQFIYDVTHGAWGDTIYSEHPGVTTMWLSGIALHLAGVTPQQGPDGAYVDPDSITARDSAIGVFPLALTIAGLIVLMYTLLVRLFNRKVAFSAALLVALDPFFIANSQVLHVDGLLAAFMSTSALALLVYLQDRRWRWVILSGVLGSLALLSKSPALFLLPYTVLCLGTGVLVGRKLSWQRGILAGLLWLTLVVLVYFVLYPAMWVDPLGTPRTVYGWSALNLELPHLNPLYFRGQVISHDPGLTYYLYSWVYKLTSLVCIFAWVTFLYAMVDRALPRHERITVGLSFAFAVSFTLQMALGAKKMPRYLLPAFPMVDVLAGVGLIWWAERIANCKLQIADRKSPFSILHSPFSIALIALGLLVQAVLILPRHPYYDTYFNELAGGPRAGIWVLSTQWQGEGLDIAARRLSELPGAERQIAGSQKTVMFRQYYVGKTVNVESTADWHIFAVNDVMRGGEAEKGSLWDFYRHRQPWTTITFDQIPYVWIYRHGADPQNPLAFMFGLVVRLVGYDIAPSPYRPGQTLRLQLYWQALEPLAEDYTVFVHVLDQAGQIVAQQDNPPVRGTRPTSTWEPGAMIVDPYDLLIPKNTPMGEYAVMIGLYRLADLSRLPVLDDTGVTLPDSRVPLTTLHVEQEPAVPGVWVARGLAALVWLSAAATLRKRSP